MHIMRLRSPFALQGCVRPYVAGECVVSLFGWCVSVWFVRGRWVLGVGVRRARRPSCARAGRLRPEGRAALTRVRVRGYVCNVGLCFVGRLRFHQRLRGWQCSPPMHGASTLGTGGPGGGTSLSRGPFQAFIPNQ